MNSEWMDLKSGEAKEILMKWWRGLEEDKGGRAYLRRARQPVEVLTCKSFVQLYNRLSGLGGINTEALAMAAAVLTHVKQDAPNLTMGRAMAMAKEGGSTGRVSGLRFRRLIAIETRVELCPALIRVVRMLGGAAPVFRLARDIYAWEAGRYGDGIRRQWAFDYYSTAPDKDDPKAA